MTHVLVRGTAGPSNAVPGEGLAALSGQVEPSLLPATSQLMRRLPADALERGYLQHLTQRLRRNPRDLRAHVRRTLIHHARADAAALDAALVDLFDVLGAQGHALRVRMLRQVGNRLTPERKRFFSAQLAAGFIRAARPATPIVASRRADGVSLADPVAVARDAIAAGHEERAQLLLEGIVCTDCGNACACAELLALYERRAAKADFLRMRATLLGRRLALPDAWQALADRFAVRA